jgi:hypothetical protein
MRIVLSLHEFASFAGTETYTLSVAHELQGLGHEAIVYAPTLGPIADAAREQGLTVVDRPEGLPGTADGVLAQDAGTAFAMAARFPDAVRVQVIHSDYHPLQSPPQLEGVCAAVVVLNDRIRHRVEALANHPPVVRLRQPVDLKRFGIRGGHERRTHRALLLGNYLRGPTAEVVSEACRSAGFEPVQAGVHATPSATPEQLMADADLVIGLGRCVIEAMASRRAAYVFGIAGGDGWVTAESYAALEADGFGGTATGRPLDGAAIAADLASWDPEMGWVNRQLAADHGVGLHAEALVEVLRTHGAVAAPTGTPADELARLVRVEWQTWARYAGGLAEAAALRRDLADEQARAREATARADQAEDALRTLSSTAVEPSELHAARAERDAAAQRLTDFQATRRYRSALRLAAPLDAVRRGFRRATDPGGGRHPG